MTCWPFSTSLDIVKICNFDILCCEKKWSPAGLRYLGSAVALLHFSSHWLPGDQEFRALCWCPGSLCHQEISSNGIECVAGPLGRISTTWTTSMLRNDRKCKYFFMFPKIKSWTRLLRDSTSAGTVVTKFRPHIDGLVQERRNSSALAMELRLSCTNTSINQQDWHLKIAYLTEIPLRIPLFSSTSVMSPAYRGLGARLQ